MGQNTSDPVLKAIIKYRSHPSIKAIKEQCNTNFYFSFSQIGHDEIMKELNNLDTNKAIQNTDMPTKLIKEKDIFANFIFENLNNCISHSIFPTSMKNAIITPVHKKGPKTSKDNFRPVIILPNISKIYERVMFKQMSEFVEPILSKYQCGFRKGFSAQHCLLAMLERRKSTVDNKKTFGALLTESKCLWVQFTSIKISAKLFYKEKTKDKDKRRIQFMGRNSVWGTPRVDFGTSFI